MPDLDEGLDVERIERLGDRHMSTQRDEVRLLLDIARLDIETRGRVVLMALGIVGVVVPLLTQSRQLTLPGLLTWACVALFVTAVTGVVAQAIERHLRNRLMTVHAQYVSAVFAAAAGGSIEYGRAEALQHEMESINKRRSLAGDWEDAILYLSFVVGAVLLISAVGFAKS